MTTVYILLVVEIVIFIGLFFLLVPWFSKDKKLSNFLSFFATKIFLVVILSFGIYLQWLTIANVAVRGFSFLAILFSFSIAGLYVGFRGIENGKKTNN